MTDIRRGLPSTVTAERLLLGAALADPQRHVQAVKAISEADWSVAAHRLIAQTIANLAASGINPDRVAVATALQSLNRLDEVGGVSGLIELDSDMPAIVTTDGWVRLIREAGARRHLALIGQTLTDRATDATQDIEAITDEVTQQIQLAGQHGRPVAYDWRTPADIIAANEGRLDALLSPARAGCGLLTPWPTFNSATGGLQPSELLILAGRPSHGKSAAALQMAHCFAVKGVASAFVSLEMSKESLFQRLVAQEARVDLQKIRLGAMDAQERAKVSTAVHRLQPLPIHVEDSGRNTMSAIATSIRKVLARHPVKCVFLDHVHLIRTSGKGADRRVQELDAISAECKRLAMVHKVTVVLLSQLSRTCEAEKREPMLADLRESGGLEQNADQVMFVHRPEMYNRADHSLRGKARFLLAKQRNGPTAAIDLNFLSGFQKFEEPTHD